jgi:ATP-dependent Clp protease protease subunit
MQYIKPDVATICTGMAASMGAVCRSSWKTFGFAPFKSNDSPAIWRSARSCNWYGNQLARNVETEDELYNIISHHSGQTFDKVHKDSERDYWMKADEAKEYGMIDEVLRRG